MAAVIGSFLVGCSKAITGLRVDTSSTGSGLACICISVEDSIKEKGVQGWSRLLTMQEIEGRVAAVL